MEIFSILSYKMSNSSNSSTNVLGGNTKPPKQESAKSNWCLTLNNWTDQEYGEIKELFSSNSSNIWIIGKEIGENGTPHLQMFCFFASKIRFTAIKKVNDRLHVEKMISTRVKNLIYCAKDGDYETNTRIPKPLKLLPPRDEWAKQVEKYALQEPNDRDIMFVNGEFCTGKTQLAKYLIGTYDFISGPLGGGLRHILCVVAESPHVETWIMNLTGEESGNLMDGKPTNLWTVLEKIKDGLFMSHFGTKGTHPVNFNSPNIIVFSNCTESDIRSSCAEVVFVRS